MSDSVKIIFTGTGSGRSSLNRFHSSFLIRSDSYNLLVDAGDGISRALLRLGIDFNEIDGVFITHLHPDHYSGFPSLILQMKMSSRRMPLELYTSKGNGNFIKELLNRSYLLEKRLPFQLNFMKVEKGSRIDFRGKFSITPYENSHLEKYREYGVKSSELKSYSMIIATPRGEVFYSGDVGSVNDFSFYKFGENSILVTETTHVSIEAVIELIQQNDLKKVILTHIESDDPSPLISKISSVYPDGLNKITVAHDGLMLTL